MARYGPRPRPVEDRFWAFVSKSPDPDGCWLWTGGTNGKYGVFRINEPRCQVYAHRFSWQLTHGYEPLQNVCHSCDVCLCVRPDHLWLGDSAANHADMVAKGRSTYGSRNAMSKLTDHQVLMIRRRIREHQHVLAREYGVSQSLIAQIAGKQIWRHLLKSPKRHTVKGHGTA